MIKIAHRINTIKDLKKVPPKYGVEVDLRSQGQNLILNHDPFCPGESFENYLKAYINGYCGANSICNRCSNVR